MSLPSNAPASEQPEVVGWDFPPRRELPRLEIDRSRLPAAGTTIGVALLGAAVVISAMYSRETGELDLSNFVMGVLASGALLIIGAVARLLDLDLDQRASLTSWPIAAGLVGVAVMTAVLIDDGDGSIYAASALTIVLSAVGYLALRAAPFVLSTVAGAALLYGKVFDDLVDTGGAEGESQFMVIGAGILGFVVLATAAGWLLPQTRVLSSIVIGTGAIVAFTFMFETMFFFRSYAMYGGDSEYGDLPVPKNPYVDDMYAILGYCAVLVALWTVGWLATGHAGFRILVIAMTVISIPVATYVLIVKHPTWWEVGLCAAGGLGLLATALRAPRSPDLGPSEPA